MSLDGWIFAALVLFAARGFHTGAIAQVAHVIGLVAAYVLAKPAAAVLAPLAAPALGWSAPATAVVFTAALMPLILIAVALAARGILNAIIPGDQRNQPDRVAGLFLGAGKAGVIAWAALSFMISFEQPLTKLRPSLADSLGGSRAAALTREHAFFDIAAPTALDRLKALTALRDDPKLVEALSKDPELKAQALKDPRLKKLLEDPAVLAKLAER